jgi:hypothetical protein
MKYFEECGDQEIVYYLPTCRECGKEIKPGKACYQHEGGGMLLCFRCGQQNVGPEVLV